MKSKPRLTLKERRLLAMGRECVTWAIESDACHLCGRGFPDEERDHDPECPVAMFLKAYPKEAAR